MRHWVMCSIARMGLFGTMYHETKGAEGMLLHLSMIPPPLLTFLKERAEKKDGAGTAVKGVAYVYVGMPYGKRH